MTQEMMYRWKTMFNPDKIVDMDKWLKEKEQADREFHRKPEWMQAVEEGDRLNDGSDEQEFEKIFDEDYHAN
jgi:hypothetical protein